MDKELYHLIATSFSLKLKHYICITYASRVLSSNAFYFTFCLKLSELHLKAVKHYPLNTIIYCVYLT